MTATSWIFEGLKPKKKNNKARKEAEIEQTVEPVRLNFDTQRIFANSRPEPVSQIMLNASDTQALSFQPTIQIPVKQGVDNASVGTSSGQSNLLDRLENGETLLNNVGKKDLIKIQASMILAISFMGLIIGMCIAFLI